jgi:hypothetical protein
MLGEIAGTGNGIDAPSKIQVLDRNPDAALLMTHREGLLVV